MDNIEIIIGSRLKKIRISKNLKQEEVAELACVHPTYIGQVERGEKNATIKSISKIAFALDVSLGYLFHDLPYENISKENIEQLLSTLDDEKKKIAIELIEKISLL